MKIKLLTIFSLLLCTPYILMADAVTANVTHASSVTSNDGAIIFSVSDGAPEYEYQWEGPSPSVNPQNENDLNIYELSPGTYCVTVTDEENCQAGICVEVLNCEIANCLDFPVRVYL